MRSGTSGAGRLGMRHRGSVALALGLFSNVSNSAATAPSIEDFASRPQVEDVSISPDGRYLALIQTHDGKALVVIVARRGTPGQPPRGVLVEPDNFRMTWCHWATNTRLLCGFRGMVR